MQNVKKILMGLSAIAVMGASCANPFVDDSTTPTPNAMVPKNSLTDSTSSTSTVTAPPGTPELSAGTGDLTLSKAEGVGNSIVEIEFSAPESVTNEATGYQLLLSKDPNPNKDNAGDWYVLGPAHRSKMWKVMASGERYVSVCALKDDTCVATSAVVKVDVK